MPRKPLKKRRKLIYAEAQEIRRLWCEDEWHIKRIAKFYDVGREQITRILDREILMEDDGRKPIPVFLNCENVPLILKLAKKKVPVREIAERVGLSEWLTRRVVKGESGAEFRPKRIRRKKTLAVQEFQALPQLPKPRLDTETAIG